MTAQPVQQQPNPEEEPYYAPVDDQGLPVPEEEIMQESGGVIMFDFYAPDGSVIKITVRSISIRGAIDRLADAIQYANTKYGWVTHPAKAPELMPAPAKGAVPAPVPLPLPAKAATPAPVPAPVPVHPPAAAPATQTTKETIEVASLFHDIGNSGNHHLKVKGGMYMKFGVAMWEESMPAGLMEMIMSWPVKQEFAPPEGMGRAIIEKLGTKVKVVQLLP
jgi:hypothetical protein